MSTVPAKTYSLFANIIQVGGFRITGFGQTDVITYSMASDIVQDDVSADGEVTISYLNDDRVYADIAVMETSLAYKNLAQLMKDQIALVKAQQAIVNLQFLHIDGISGDRVSDAQCTFKIRPGPSKGRTVGERVFQVVLPNAADQILFGISITQ